MTRLRLVPFILFLLNTPSNAQERVSIVIEKNPSISEIFDKFKNRHNYNFSFDVEAVASLQFQTDKKNISIDEFQEIVEKQTQYILKKVDNSSYILILNNKTITVCGIVIDAQSKFELSQADIVKKDRTVDLTDDQGFFELNLSPWDSISVTYLGYKTKTIKVSEFTGIACDTLRLEPTIQSLNKVLINEYLTQGVQKNEDGSVNVSTKELGILPGLVEPDVLQSLQLLPGITSPSEDPAGLHIRGGTPDQNLVLWDGIKMYQYGHFFNQISTFNPHIVQNVSVYRGGTSVRYGDRISGVIKIESDDDLLEKFKIGGGANLTHADLHIKTPLSNKLGVMIAGRRSTLDIHKNIAFNNLVRKVFQNTRADIPDKNSEKTIEENSRKNNFDFYDLNFKLIWLPNDLNTIKFSSIFVENRLNNTRDLPATNFSTSVLVFDIFKQRNTGIGFNWEKKYFNKVIQKTNFYFSEYNSNYQLKKRGIITNEKGVT